MSEKIVSLTRSETAGFGFSIVGGGPSALVVSKVQPGTAAETSGQINVGDILLEIGGVSLVGYTTFRVNGWKRSNALCWGWVEEGYEEMFAYKYARIK